ncbi:BamA/TamA family outer membrane protein [Mucilaginibacter sp. HMF5004]|uniref:translocation and assembly module lipoprotein TamL n=1 Tax=Mucilaginibacter rivuli TaxID=2857527 RepID=UPI001C5DD8C8|nr:BamA/TamA family outer membrane protein [Mucilaginibacter rivuli]MBW4890828.1 BamA/TamA family outer membrane protein [Mucilaginibacter rivuli]
MAKRLSYLILLAIIASSCSNIKYLPDGQKLYTGANITIKDKSVNKKEQKAIKTELSSLIRPQPNAKILGLRFKLWLHNISKGKKNFISRFINKRGEPPVLFSAVDIDQNSKIFQNRLQNESYFQAQAEGDSVVKGRRVSVNYTVQTGPAYHINELHFPTDTGSLDTAVAGTRSRSLLKVGDKYNLDVIKAERVRIDARLKEEGFYYFNADDILVQIDSTNAGKNMVNEYVTIKQETNDKAWDIYTIKNIYIYPRYSLRDTSVKLDSAKRYDDYFVIDPRNTIHPYVFRNVMSFHPGEPYNRADHNQALSRFIDLGPYKFVKNNFVDASDPGSPKLNAFYYLTPYRKKSLRFELLGRTTSANFTGTQATLSWKNRNAFFGAELLTVSLLASSDIQASGQNSGYNVYQTGIQTSLTWPRFITPMRVNSNSDYLPRTNLQLEYDLTTRTNLYNLNAFKAQFGYQWRQDKHISHDLELTSITYVSATNVTKQYTDSINKTQNPTLKHVIDNQLTFGPTYSYTYTNTAEDYKTNTYFFNGKVGLSANLLGLISGADTLGGRDKKIFGTNYNQYVKLESELRFYHNINSTSKFAARFYAGAGLSYGNSTLMPYSQQFFIGGSNSLRGFRARSVGPGSYTPTNTSGIGFLPDESGDIKLEANLEYRPKLFSIVYGALFIDAGNIWNLRSHNGLDGAAFGKNFLSQIAADAGFGLRFDVTVLVLRTDLGFPIRKPYLPEGQRWVINKVNFLDGGWRSQNLVFNLAIGYPF